MSPDEFQRHFSNLAAPMTIANSEGYLVETNEAFCRYIGYSREELLQLSIFDYTHPDDLENTKSYFRQIAEGQIDNFHYEKRYVRKDGTEVWAVVTTSWHTVEGTNKNIGIAVIQDITKRVRAEQSCQRSERLLQSLMDNIDLGVALIDKNHEILALNRTQAEMFDKLPEDFIGKRCFREFEKRDAICQHCPGVRALREGKPHVVETEGVRDDGSRFLVKIRALPVLDDFGEPHRFVEVVEDITQSRQLEEELRENQDRLNYLAHHDQLTGLANRTLFYDRVQHGVERARRKVEGLALVIFHVDRFGKINESLGYDTGNKVIKAISDRMKIQLRASDSLSRIGGNEFALMLEKTDGMHTSAKVSERILSLFDDLFKIEEHELHLTASIGVSLYPEDGETVEALLHAAEAAMNKAGDRGGNSYEYYQPKMSEEARRFIDIESRLYSAIKLDQFEAYYQPQVNPVTGHVVGLEALARWQDPKKGLISPAEFIPVAEQTGLILPLGEKMLEIACRQAEQWMPEIPLTMRVSVNVSPLQIYRTDLGRTITNVLMETGLPPSHLEIEITESALINEPEKAIKVLKTVKNLGVRVALDDFGTGYSAMGYLKNFPIDRIKIDRSFIWNLTEGSHEMAIVETIFTLGRKLGIEIVAEGVETADQLQRLLDMGCTAVQGYYFSRPLDKETITESLPKWFRPGVCPFGA